MYTVILAGGGGTRLQPLSTEENPKQFLPLTNEKSLLQNTVERILHIDPKPENIAISTTIAYQEKSLNQLEEYGVTTIISEPERRNTAPAIAYTIKYLEEKKGAGPEDLVLICPSDHHITPIKKFVDYIKIGQQEAKKGKIVLFGITPTIPETGYGYIKAEGEGEILAIKEFKEKPDEEMAKKYLLEGNYFWNAGIFLFSIQTMKREFQKHTPEIGSALDLSFDKFIKKFSELPKISIDYAVMEHTQEAVLVPMAIERSDLGNWDAVREYGKKDEEGNLIVGNQKITPQTPLK